MEKPKAKIKFHYSLQNVLLGVECTRCVKYWAWLTMKRAVFKANAHLVMRHRDD